MILNGKMEIFYMFFTLFDNYSVLSDKYVLTLRSSTVIILTAEYSYVKSTNRRQISMEYSD